MVFFSALGCDGRRRRLLARLDHLGADLLQALAAQPLADLGEPLLLLLLDVVLDVLDQHRRLGGEPLVVGLHRRELDDEDVGDVVLLVGLEHVVLDLGQQLAHARVHHLVLEVGVHGQQLDDPVDQPALGDGRVRRRPSRSPEGLADLLVVVLEQDDRVGGHLAPRERG